MKETKNGSKCTANFPDLHHRREAHVLCTRLVLLKNPAWANVPAHQTSNCRGIDQIEVDSCYQQLQTNAPILEKSILCKKDSPSGAEKWCFLKGMSFCWLMVWHLSQCFHLSSTSKPRSYAWTKHENEKRPFDCLSFIAIANSLSLLYLYNS